MEQTSAITGFFLCFPLFFYPLCADILALHSFTSPLNSANFLTFSSSGAHSAMSKRRNPFSKAVFRAIKALEVSPKPCKHRLPKSSLPPLCQHVPHVRNLSRLFCARRLYHTKFLCIKAKAHRYCSPLLPL